MKTETLKFIVNEIASLSRANMSLEKQGEIRELNELVSVIAGERDTARDEVERLKKDASIVPELRQQIEEQKRTIEQLENEIGKAEFKRSTLELENSQLAAEFEHLNASRELLSMRLDQLNKEATQAPEEKDDNNGN